MRSSIHGTRYDLFKELYDLFFGNRSRCDLGTKKTSPSTCGNVFELAMLIAKQPGLEHVASAVFSVCFRRCTPLH